MMGGVTCFRISAVSRKTHAAEGRCRRGGWLLIATPILSDRGSRIAQSVLQLYLSMVPVSALIGRLSARSFLDLDLDLSRTRGEFEAFSFLMWDVIASRDWWENRGAHTALKTMVFHLEARQSFSFNQIMGFIFSGRRVSFYRMFESTDDSTS